MQEAVGSSPINSTTEIANAISSHSIELDDIDVLALFHFSPPVFSAALAAAERQPDWRRKYREIIKNPAAVAWPHICVLYGNISVPQ